MHTTEETPLLLPNTQSDLSGLSWNDIFTRLKGDAIFKQSENETHLFYQWNFQQEQTRYLLLCEIARRLGVEQTKSLIKQKSWSSKVGLLLVVIAGTIVSICNGFDGSITILVLFTGIPFWPVFIIGLILSLVLVVLFFGIDLIQLSQYFNVELHHSRQLLDIFVDQAELISRLLKKIEQYTTQLSEDLLNNRPEQTNDLPLTGDELNNLLVALTSSQHDLSVVRQMYTDEMQAAYVRAMHVIVASIAGILAFNCGFFAGQSFAIVVLSAFVTTSISAMNWPVLLISIGVGLAALSVYWCAGRADVEDLVSRWLGLDRERIEQLPDGNDDQGKVLARQVSLLNKFSSICNSRKQEGQIPFETLVGSFTA